MARGRVAAAFTVLCLLAAVHSVSAALKDVSMTTLILTTPGWTQFDHITSVMNAYGAPYEIKAVQPSEIEGGANALNMTQFMTNSDTSGKYALIVATPSNVINIWGGVLSLNQINDLYAYQVAFGARMVLEGPYVPSFGADIPGGPPGLGVQFLNSADPAPGVVTSTVLATAPLGSSGIKAGAPMDLTGLYTTPVTITDTNRSTPVSQVVTPSEYAAGYTAVTTKFPSGREQFTTFYPCAAFSSDCLLTAHMYFAWGMHGIIPGSRDSLFSLQIDDLFAYTQEPFQPDPDLEFRMTAADSKALATYMANVPNLPAGSNIKLEFVYNNAGYIEATQLAKYEATWTGAQPPEQLQTYYKPPGTGVSLMPANPDTSWWDATQWKKDGLYNEIAFGTSGLTFYLGHHTFNHEVLNAATYSDTVQQIRLNQLAAAPWNTTNGKFNRFSQTAMVTPGISGFRNKDALQALVDTGITAAVGDSSWPHLRNQANPWLAQITSAADNGTIDGFYILPRSPTEIYFDVSTEAQQVRLYNQIYCCDTYADLGCSAGCAAGRPFAQPATWADILNREALRVSRLMFALRPEGHMFHQANCRAAAGSGAGSLLRQWISKVVATYSAKVTWPLISFKLDDQLTYAKKRVARDVCSPKYKLQYDDATKAASQLTISSASGNCEAPVMIPGTVPVGGANTNVRVMGKEPYVYTVNLPGSTSGAPVTKVLTLGAGANWS